MTVYVRFAKGTVPVLTFAVLGLNAHIVQDSPQCNLIFFRFLPANPFFRVVMKLTCMFLGVFVKTTHMQACRDNISFTPFFPFLV